MEESPQPIQPVINRLPDDLSADFCDFIRGMGINLDLQEVYKAWFDTWIKILQAAQFLQRPTWLQGDRDDHGWFYQLSAHLVDDDYLTVTLRLFDNLVSIQHGLYGEELIACAMYVEVVKLYELQMLGDMRDVPPERLDRADLILTYAGMINLALWTGEATEALPTEYVPAQWGGKVA